MNDAPNPHPLTVISKQLDDRTVTYAKSLPAHYPVERFKRDIISALASNPDLVTCDRASLFNSVNRMAGIGLRVDGRQAALVPFRDRDRGMIAVPMIMVAGWLTLFRNSGQFKQVAVEVVRIGDEFDYFIDNDGPHVVHRPAGSDKPLSKAYALAITKDGGVFIEVMTAAQIEKRRNVSRAKDGPMWRGWYDEAAKKTVLRSLLKLVPLSSDDLDRLDRVDDDETTFESAPLPPEPTEPRKKLSVASALDKLGGEAPGDVVDVEASPTPPTETSAASPESDSKEPAPDLLSDHVRRRATMLAAAQERGKQARVEGLHKRALPPEYREAGREAEAEAWRKGWDS